MNTVVVRVSVQLHRLSAARSTAWHIKTSRMAASNCGFRTMAHRLVTANGLQAEPPRSMRRTSGSMRPVSRGSQFFKPKPVQTSLQLALSRMRPVTRRRERCKLQRRVQDHWCDGGQCWCDACDWCYLSEQKPVGAWVLAPHLQRKAFILRNIS